MWPRNDAPPQGISADAAFSLKTGAYSLIPSSQPADTEEQGANRVFLAMVTKMVTVAKNKASR